MKLALVLTSYDGKLPFTESLESNSEIFRKQTLGCLFKAFKQKSDVSAGAEQLFDRFVSERNTFAHHLGELPGFSLATIEGIEVGIHFLKTYYETTLLIESFLIPLLLSILMTYLKTFYTDDSEDPFKQHCMALRERLDVVNKTLAEKFNRPVTDHHELGVEDFFHEQLKMAAIVEAVNAKTLDKLNLEDRVIQLWAQTEIIRALKEIGMRYADDWGWASLAICGKRLKQEYPHIRLEDYGYEKLSRLLEIANVFEIKRDHNGVYFRPTRFPQTLN